jgi:hypothetical protein
VESVDFNGLHAQVERLRYLASAFALANQLKDLEFPIR